MAKDHPCESCPHVATCSNDLIQHNRRSHAPPDTRYYECSICQKLFTSPTILRQHKDTHSLETCFICFKTGCKLRGRPLGSESNYKRHLHTHDPSKQVSCHACGRKLSRGDSLKRHSRVCKLKTDPPPGALATAQQASTSALSGSVDGTPHHRQVQGHAHHVNQLDEGRTPVTVPSLPRLLDDLPPESEAGPSRLTDLSQPSGATQGGRIARTFVYRRQPGGSGRYHPYPSQALTTGYVQVANVRDPNGNLYVAGLVPLFRPMPLVPPILHRVSLPPRPVGYYPHTELTAFGGGGPPYDPATSMHVLDPYIVRPGPGPRDSSILHGIAGDLSVSGLPPEPPRFISPGPSIGRSEGLAGAGHYGRSNSLTPTDSFSSTDMPSVRLADPSNPVHAMRQLGEPSSNYQPLAGPSSGASSASVLSQDQEQSAGAIFHPMSHGFPAPPAPLPHWSQTREATLDPQYSQISEESEIERQVRELLETQPLGSNDPFMFDDDMVILESFGRFQADCEDKADADNAGL